MGGEREQALLRHKAIDKWTGRLKTYTLENGDTIEECVQPGQGLTHGAVIGETYVVRDCCCCQFCFC